MSLNEFKWFELIINNANDFSKIIILEQDNRALISKSKFVIYYFSKNWVHFFVIHDSKHEIIKNNFFNYSLYYWYKLIA